MIVSKLPRWENEKAGEENDEKRQVSSDRFLGI